MTDKSTAYRDRLNNDSSPCFANFKTLEHTFVGKKICKSNIYDIQYGLSQTCQKLINREDTAAALAKRNILRQVRTIQISTSIKFVSIEFDTPTIMETFCL